jgi:hypothetical protein
MQKWMLWKSTTYKRIQQSKHTTLGTVVKIADLLGSIPGRTINEPSDK